jgi:hypothetical protein
VVILGLLVFTLHTPVLAQMGSIERNLIASGTSPLPVQDSAYARKLALEEALRSAVEQALGWLLPAERIVQFYPLLLNRILAEPMAYIQNYQIIHEGPWSQLYRVTIQTSLYGEGLERDLRRLGLYLAPSEQPRVAILVAERTDPQGSYRWWWQSEEEAVQDLVFTRALTELMLARALVPLSPEVVRVRIPESPTYQEPHLQDDQGISLAKELGAQVVVLGQVSFQPDNNQRGGTASGTLRVLNAESGELLGQDRATVTVQVEGEQPAEERGFKALAEQLAPELTDKALAPFVTVSLPAEEVTVQVLGVVGYSDLIVIKEYLHQTPEVKEIKQMELQPGLGYFTLVLSGELETLERAFSDHDFGSFTTTAVANRDNNLLTLSISRNR